MGAGYFELPAVTFHGIKTIFGSSWWVLNPLRSEDHWGGPNHLRNAKCSGSMKPFPGGDWIPRVWYIYLHLVEIIWLMFLPILLDFVGNQEPGGFKEFCLPLLTATFCLYPIWRTYVRTAWQYFSPCSYTAMDPENCENTWMQVPGCALLQLGWFVGSTGIISAFLHIQWFVYFALHHPWNHQQEYVWFTYFRHQKKHWKLFVKFWNMKP